MTPDTTDESGRKLISVLNLEGGGMRGAAGGANPKGDGENDM
jgi:hypothetical protein